MVAPRMLARATGDQPGGTARLFEPRRTEMFPVTLARARAIGSLHVVSHQDQWAIVALHSFGDLRHLVNGGCFVAIISMSR